jgi:hypothetical protein
MKMQTRICLSLALALVHICFGASAEAADASPSAAYASAAQVSSAPGRVTFAVVIGNNKSLGRRRPDLHYADDDDERSASLRARRRKLSAAAAA